MCCGRAAKRLEWIPLARQGLLGAHSTALTRELSGRLSSVFALTDPQSRGRQ